jgi:hypothetical protein
MDLDVRLPIGLMFTLFGALLAVFGLAADPRIFAEHSLGIDVDLDWGLALLGFGLTMLAVALRARRAARRAATSPPRRDS